MNEETPSQTNPTEAVPQPGSIEHGVVDRERAKAQFEETISTLQYMIERGDLTEAKSFVESAFTKEVVQVLDHSGDDWYTFSRVIWECAQSYVGVTDFGQSNDESRPQLKALIEALIDVALTDELNPISLDFRLQSVWENLYDTDLLDREMLVEKTFTADRIDCLIDFRGFLATDEERAALVLRIINTRPRKDIEQLMQARRWQEENTQGAFILNTATVKALIKSGNVDMVVQRMELLEDDVVFEPHELREVINAYSLGLDWSHGDSSQERFSAARAERVWQEIVARNAKIQADPALMKVIEELGEGETPDYYMLAARLENGEQIEWIENLVDKGESATGAERVRAAYAGFVQRVFTEGLSEEDVVALRDNPTLRMFYKKLVRYEQSQFGSHTDKDFEATINTYLGLLKADKLDPLPDEIAVGMISPHKVTTNEVYYGKNFSEVYAGLITTFNGAGGERPDSIAAMAEVVTDEILPQMKVFLEELKTENANPKRIEYLEGYIAQIESSTLSGRQSLEQMFILLVNIREEAVGVELKEQLNKRLQQLIVQTHVRRDMWNMNANFNPHNYEAPTREELSKLIDYLGHSLQQEFVEARGYLKTKAGIKAFRSLFKISVLEEQLNNWSVTVDQGVTPTRVVPTRDLLTEFSGHAGDACWANRYDSICQKFPNAVSYTLVQNLETKDVRAAGSFLTLDTHDTNTNEPVMVIRGLNPIENYINRVDPESFLEELKNYLIPIAKKRGMKLAIVIDGHSGGAGTNRPTLFTHLDSLTSSLKRCPIPDEYAVGDGRQMLAEVNPTPMDHIDAERRTLEMVARHENNDFGKPTNFNGYNISDCTYYL